MINSVDSLLDDAHLLVSLHLKQPTLTTYVHSMRTFDVSVGRLGLCETAMRPLNYLTCKSTRLINYFICCVVATPPLLATATILKYLVP